MGKYVIILRVFPFFCSSLPISFSLLQIHVCEKQTIFNRSPSPDFISGQPRMSGCRHYEHNKRQRVKASERQSRKHVDSLTLCTFLFVLILSAINSTTPQRQKRGRESGRLPACLQRQEPRTRSRKEHMAMKATYSPLSGILTVEDTIAQQALNLLEMQSGYTMEAIRLLGDTNSNMRQALKEEATAREAKGNAEGKVETLERWRTESRTDMEAMKAERNTAISARQAAEQARDKAQTNFETERKSANWFRGWWLGGWLIAGILLVALLVLNGQRNAAEEAHRTAIAAAQTQVSDLQKQLASAIGENTGLRNQLADAKAQAAAADTQAKAWEKVADRLMVTRIVTPTNKIEATIVITPARLGDLRPSVNVTGSSNVAINTGSGNLTVTQPITPTTGNSGETTTATAANPQRYWLGAYRTVNWPVIGGQTVTMGPLPQGVTPGEMYVHGNSGEEVTIFYHDWSVTELETGYVTDSGTYYVAGLDWNNECFVRRVRLTKSRDQAMESRPYCVVQ